MHHDPADLVILLTQISVDTLGHDSTNSMRTREQAGRGGGRTSKQGGRGNGANGGVNEVPDFATVIAQQLQDLLPTIEFVACKPNEFNGKGGVVAYIHWVEKMKAVQDISSCGDNQKVKYSAGSLTGRALTWWNSEVKTKGWVAGFGVTWEEFMTLMKEEYSPRNEMQRLVPHLVTPETKRIKRYIYGLAPQICGMVGATEPPTIQNAILKAGVLTDEAVLNGSLKKNDGESSKEGNFKGDNKRARTRKVFATITNHVRKEYMDLDPNVPTDYRTGHRMVNPLNSRSPTTTHEACFEGDGTDHYKSACPRLNRAPGQGENHLNRAMAIEGGQGHGNNNNLTRLKAFVMVAEEALQDPNIMTGTFFLNNHYATMLFDSGAKYSFVSTTFVPLLDIEPSSLVQIPPPHGEMLRVYGERPEEKVKRLMSAKAEEPKLQDIAIVRNFSEIIDPTMTTRNVGRRTAATRGGSTGGQAGRGGGRTKEQAGRGGGRTDLLSTIIAQVGDHVSNQGNIGSQNDKATDDSIHEDDRNVNLGNGRNGYSYKEFVACKLKEFDGKGGVVAYIRWVEKIDQEAEVGMTCSRVTLWFGASHATKIDRFHEHARLVPHLVTLETKRTERYIYGLALQIRRMVATIEPSTIQNAILKAEVLTDEAVRNRSLKRNDDESSKEQNVKGDNKTARIRKVFATINNPIRKEYTGSAPKCTNCNFHHNPETPCRMCTNYNRLGNFSKDCKMGPRMVNPLNAKNSTATREACFECGVTDHYKSTCPRAFMMGEEEARQDPNIVTGTFSLNNHYAIMLFDSGADYSFVSTTFVLLLEIKPSSLAVFMYLMNRVCRPYLDKFVIVFIDDILVYSKIREEHEMHLLLILDLLKKEKLDGIYVDPSKIEAVKNWEAPKSPKKKKKYIWEDEQKMAFQTLKEKLCNAPVPALLDGPKDFMSFLATMTAKVATILSSIMGKILEAQNEASKVVNAPVEMLRGLDEQMERRRVDKMYYDLRDMYWWPGMKKDIALYVSDLVLLKVLPWKCVVRFGKKGNLAPRFIGPFEITRRIGPIAYRLKLPQELSSVHDTFHALNIKKCLGDPTLHVPLEKIQVDVKLNFVEEPVEILEREIKKLKRTRIPIVKTDMAYLEQLNTAYQSSDTTTESDSSYLIFMLDFLYYCSSEQILLIFLPSSQIILIRRLTCVTVNGKRAYELKSQFLDDLRFSAFSGTNEEDAVKHIDYFLKIVDPINFSNVNHERLRLATFLISLIRNASKLFDEIKASKFANHAMMDPFTKKVLWYFYKRSDDQNRVIDDGFSDLEGANNDDEQEISEIFIIETNLFNYETPLCIKFNEFNYFLKVDPEFFTYDIKRTKTYKDYENELNDELEEPWSKEGVPYEICDHICEPFRFKNGETKWPTCNSNEDGFCDGGELPRMVRVGYMTYFQDHESYNGLMDETLKNEALEQKPIYEKS
uniref:Tf2-1-like SH3-like domain-containing protein n=1 Tax=Tanacetum cinerariifolium TaxID=118510 RepID=A0A6L2LJC6_TANCI|nr:hypothetical protein [Tanacetum cinerariifolium]